MELSGEFPVKLLCETMGILRSSFYSWKKRLSNPSDRTRNLVSSILLFKEYHMKYPSHRYRWLNAKIRLDTGLVLSDPYAHKCCKMAGIKSMAKHYNELLPMYGISRSMSRAGTPTDNAAMEAINGWIKAELFMDLHVTGERPVQDEVDEYIVFFNEQRPAYSLNYLTPKQYRESFSACPSV